MPAPLITVPTENPLPQFTLWGGEEPAVVDGSDADVTLRKPSRSPLVAPFASASVGSAADTSDTDATLRRPTRVRVPTLEDPTDHAPTIKRSALAPSDAAAVLLARRFRATTQLSSLGDEDVTQKRTAKTNTLRPVAMDVASTEEIDLDLAEIEELPLDELDALSADSSPEVIALYRRLRVRRFGARTVTALIGVGIVLLGLGGAQVGQRALAARVDVGVATTTHAVRTTPAAQPTATAIVTAAPVAEAATQAPPAATQVPAATAQVPAATTQVPAATAQVPAAVTKAPASITKVPASTAKTPASAAKAPAAFAKPAAASGKPGIGLLRTPASAKGHRVYVDGIVAGFAPNPISLRCGPHTVKVGSAGSSIKIVVPCGGAVSVGQ